MDLGQYYDLIRPLPLPTDEQVARFAKHVQFAHSWYKHLPLEGEEFVIFFDPNAGGGFTEAQPRLHHTWQTRSQYLELFGHLAHMRRSAPNLPFTTDYQLNARVAFTEGRGELVDRLETAVLELPPEILRDSGFILYPFAWDNGVFERRFEEQLRRIAAGELEHRLASLLTDYYRTEQVLRPIHAAFHAELRRRFQAGLPCRGTLNPCEDGRLDEWDYVRAEKEALRAIARDPERCHELNAVELEFFRPKGGVTFATLVQHEEASIKFALNALRRHLDAAGCRPARASPQPPAGETPALLATSRPESRLGRALGLLLVLPLLCAPLIGPCLLVSAGADALAVSAFIHRSTLTRVKLAHATEQEQDGYRTCEGLLEFNAGREDVHVAHALRLSEDEHCPAEGYSVLVRYDPRMPKDARVEDTIWGDALGKALLGCVWFIFTLLLLFGRMRAQQPAVTASH
jgi:hypothetical protein